MVYNIALADIDPVLEPITLDEAKKWLKMELISDDDDLIEELIVESRMWVERYCAISMVPKSVKCIVNLHCNGSVELPYGPIDKDSIVVTDINSNEITCGFRLLGDTGTFIDIQGHGIFNISYSSIAHSVATLRGAIKAYIAYAYEHRGDALSDEADKEFAKDAKRKAYPFMRQIFI